MIPYTIDQLTAADWPAIAAIYRAGIETGNATFETRLPSWKEWDAAHLAAPRLAARQGARLVGWAALSPVSRRKCYRGVAEVSIYVATAYRGQGIGSALLRALISASEEQGIWTLQGSTFAENVASLHMQQYCGFRIVGRRERIAQLHGVWRDTVLTERRSSRAGME